MLKKILLIFLFLLETVSISSQTDLGNKELYKWFDFTVGQENTGLVDGVTYRDLYKGEKGNHKYYLTSAYHIGNISYNGQQYFDIEMKYDLHDDQVIVKIPSRTIIYTIQLIKNKVDNFSISDSEFISLNNLTKYKNGFYEIIFKSEDLYLYKKNIKTSNKYYSGRSIFYKFKNSEEYLCYFKSEYYKITKSKKSLIKLFPEYKKEINLFYKSQSELLNINYDLFMKKLMAELNNRIANQHL